jgi:DNA polymerase-3 subunit delta'
MRHVPLVPLVSQGNHPGLPRDRAGGARDEAEAESRRPPKAEKAKSVVIKIDQIRAVADFISLSTHRSGYRVLLLHPAEAMQPAAANALLKTLEEPPPRTLIVLVSDQPARLLATIRSRCRTWRSPCRRAGEALEWLRGEGMAQPETALAAARRGAASRPRPRRARGGRAAQARRRRALAPGAPTPCSSPPRSSAPTVGALIYWMQTWVHDLVRLKLRAAIRHHRDSAPALQARAKRGRPRIALRARPGARFRAGARGPSRSTPAAGRAPADGLQSGDYWNEAMSDVAAADPQRTAPGSSPW